MADNHPSVIVEAARTTFPGNAIRSIEYEGEGDFCRAYTLNGEWLFRLAYNEEGSRSLEREISLLPVLAPTLPLRIPNIKHTGTDEQGFRFVCYPRIPGSPLTRNILLALPTQQQTMIASELAAFLTVLHSFNRDTARQLGVIEAPYPFSRTEDGIMQGSAPEIYHRELARLLGYPVLDSHTRTACARIVEQIMALRPGATMVDTLVHGDLSQDHLLFDTSTERITGVIDFSDAISTTPLLDFMYLRRAYGEAFFSLLLDHYSPSQPVDRAEVTAQVKLLRGWHAAMRLLWTLDHNYVPGIEARLAELKALI